MSSKGFFELVYYVYFMEMKVILGAVYAVGVMGVIFNASILPIAIKYLHDICETSEVQVHKKSGDIKSLSHNSELKILVFVHGSDDVAPLISFIRATHPTKDSPLDLLVLHLRQMVGSHTPIFVVHRSEEIMSGHVMNSFEDVVLAFYQLEQDLYGLVTINAFTAISPPKFMDQDICTLTFNKQTSLVLLPFHRKWSSGGFIVSDSSVVRHLNRSVLNRAFCSVGILIQRPTTKEKLHSSLALFNLCVIFFGGKDDREALALAKRMAKDPRVSLTIIHFTPKDEIVASMNWERIQDNEALKEVRMSNIDGDQSNNVIYEEQKVNDGPETALIIRKLVNDYDLIIVGRRYGLESAQTSGLYKLAEFPELGTVGDFLASTDVDCCTSTLVVQQ